MAVPFQLLVCPDEDDQLLFLAGFRPIPALPQRGPCNLIVSGGGVPKTIIRPVAGCFSPVEEYYEELYFS